MRISVVIIPVTDMARAIAFYIGTIGLKLKFDGPDYSELETGSIPLALEKRERVISEGPAFALEVTDIRERAAALKKAGVEFVEALKEEKWGLVAIVRDSEGNRLELVQYKETA